VTVCALNGGGTLFAPKLSTVYGGKGVRVLRNGHQTCERKRRTTLGLEGTVSTETVCRGNYNSVTLTPYYFLRGGQHTAFPKGG